MLDFIAERITPGLPDQDCRVYDMEGKLKRVISNVKMAPEVGQVDCAGRPMDSQAREEQKRKPRTCATDWDAIIPIVIKRLEAGEQSLKVIADDLGIKYVTLHYQLRSGQHGQPFREWRTAYEKKHGRKIIPGKKGQIERVG
mgnify:CR=1 FL=1